MRGIRMKVSEMSGVTLAVNAMSENMRLSPFGSPQACCDTGPISTVHTNAVRKANATNSLDLNKSTGVAHCRAQQT